MQALHAAVARMDGMQLWLLPLLLGLAGTHEARATEAWADVAERDVAEAHVRVHEAHPGVLLPEDRAFQHWSA